VSIGRRGANPAGEVEREEYSSGVASQGTEINWGCCEFLYGGDAI
jgi:hypothetical protein